MLPTTQDPVLDLAWIRRWICRLRAPRENGFVLKCSPDKKSISPGPKYSKGLGNLVGV